MHRYAAQFGAEYLANATLVDSDVDKPNSSKLSVLEIFGLVNGAFLFFALVMVTTYRLCASAQERLKRDKFTVFVPVPREAAEEVIGGADKSAENPAQDKSFCQLYLSLLAQVIVQVAER
jgi:hypothetical protein